MIGLGVLCDGHRAFIDCSHQMLLMEYFSLLPPEVVVEIQETVPADEAVVAVCRRLKDGGYQIALDDFVPQRFPAGACPVRGFHRSRSQESFERGQYRNGFPLRQQAVPYAGRKKSESRSRILITPKKSGLPPNFGGYFFHQVEHLRARQIPASQATAYLRLLRAIAKT